VQTSLFILVLAIALFITSYFAYLYYKATNNLKLLSTKFEELKISNAIISQDEKKYREKSEKLENESINLITLKTEAETRIANQLEINQKLENEISNLRFKLEELNEQKNLALREKEKFASQVENIQTQMEDWQKTKDEHINIAKASILEAGSKLSNKLLDDHKRESENAKKESQTLVKNTTENLIKQHEGLIERVSILQKGVGKADAAVHYLNFVLLSEGYPLSQEPLQIH